MKFSSRSLGAVGVGGFSSLGTEAQHFVLARVSPVFPASGTATYTLLANLERVTGAYVFGDGTPAGTTRGSIIFGRQ